MRSIIQQYSATMMSNLRKQKENGSYARVLRSATMTTRLFSSAERIPPPHPTKFRSPRVKELYFSLIELSKEDLHHIASYTMKQIGMDMEKEMERQKTWMTNNNNKTVVATESVVVEAAPVEVKTSFDIKLTGFDAAAKIKVIKEIRAMTGLGLKEAKELVEGVPKLIKKGIKLEEAESLAAKLKEVGATIEIV
jgi:large subunit ribosomal protein L7/L12